MPLPLPNALIDLARNPYLAVATPVLLGLGSGFITRSFVNGWYKDVRKPPMEPPRLAFPIAWTYLYATMGYTSHLLAQSIPFVPGASTALSVYYAQLALNMAWTPLFFGAKQPGFALVDIVALTGTVGYLTNLTRKISTKGFYLLIPYCAWLSFATYLNGGIWWLNGGERRIRDVKGKGKDIKKDL